MEIKRYFFRKFEENQISNGRESKYRGAYIFYQSSDYKFALKRGIGICSQDAISFANLINKRYNIDYNIIGLDGHVLLQAKINNKFDFIISQNSFAHNPKPIEFLKNVKKLMHEKSLLIIQTSQADMCKNLEFDTIYHEHINFFNIFILLLN